MSLVSYETLLHAVCQKCAGKQGLVEYSGGDEGSEAARVRMDLFGEGIGRAPASLALVQKTLDQGAIGVYCVAMAPPGVPVMAFLVVALRVSQAKVEQVTGAAQAAGANMLNRGPEARLRIEAQASAADEAFARPEAIGVAEGGISGSDLIFLAC